MNILATIVDLKASNSICAHALVLRECLERPGLFRARYVRGVCSLAGLLMLPRFLALDVPA